MKNAVPKSEREVVEMVDVLKQRMIKGQPLGVTDKLDDSMAKMHLGAVNDLLAGNGKSVFVLHIPY